MDTINITLINICNSSEPKCDIIYNKPTEQQQAKDDIDKFFGILEKNQQCDSNVRLVKYVFESGIVAYQYFPTDYARRINDLVDDMLTYDICISCRCPSRHSRFVLENKECMCRCDKFSRDDTHNDRCIAIRYRGIDTNSFSAIRLPACMRLVTLFGPIGENEKNTYEVWKHLLSIAANERSIMSNRYVSRIYSPKILHISANNNNNIKQFVYVHKIYDMTVSKYDIIFDERKIVLNIREKSKGHIKNAFAMYVIASIVGAFIF